MNYKEAIEYLDSFINYEKDPYYNYKTSFKLDRMEYLSELLGNPHKGLKVIHITGSKGKGSTAAITASVLKASGLKSGLYTSPHLISFRERIRINDEEIKEDEVANLTEEIKSTVDRSKEKDFSFFEIYTALGFLYFKRKKVDIAVIEVGLGGRLDATNVVDSMVACITPISFEHTRQLGPTLKDIAREKAAIIKKGSICISAPQIDEARKVILSECKNKGVKFYEVGKDIFYESVGVGSDSEIFNVFGIFGEYPHLKMRLLGEHQVVNATTAIGIIEALRFYNIVIPIASIREGLGKANWPGRLEIASEKPKIVLDGAQNRASANVLKKAVKRIFNFNRLILILGISKDKDIRGICEELEEISDEVVLTKANLARAEDPNFLRKFINKKSHITNSVKDAIELAKKVSKKDDLILITGSLFVVGEAKQILYEKI